MENPLLETFNQQSFPELASALRNRIPKVLARFRTLVSEVLPSADKLTLAELYDHIPRTLEDLADSIVTEGATSNRDFLQDSRDHGLCRYHQSYNVGELMLEYGVLRSVMLEEVSDAMARPLTLVEIAGLNAGLDAGCRRAVSGFVKYQSQEIQATADAQSRYLSFLSHDLRGSLNGILLTMELLRRELGGFPQLKSSVEDLDLMRRSIHETVTTMDRLVHSEQFRKGKIAVKLSQVDLPALLNYAATHSMPEMKHKGLELVMEFSGPQSVVTDREIVTIILQNLLGNAVKYGDRGQVRLTTGMLEGFACRIAVADNGPGIEAEQLKTIFQPFVRGHTHGKSGAGLGLSIASQAADLIEARLSAESTVGQGATFYVDLPNQTLPGSA
jgi:anti-sigma regulatory factor (Ser/Thr protein kinase)